jgi:hypothetical protein
MKSRALGPAFDREIAAIEGAWRCAGERTCPAPHDALQWRVLYHSLGLLGADDPAFSPRQSRQDRVYAGLTPVQRPLTVGLTDRCTRHPRLPMGVLSRP